MKEYDLISRGLEETETVYGSEPGETTAPETVNSPAIEGYELVFDKKAALKPVTLVPIA